MPLFPQKNDISYLLIKNGSQPHDNFFDNMRSSFGFSMGAQDPPITRGRVENSLTRQQLKYGIFLRRPSQWMPSMMSHWSDVRNITVVWNCVSTLKELIFAGINFRGKKFSQITLLDISRELNFENFREFVNFNDFRVTFFS